MATDLASPRDRDKQQANAGKGSLGPGGKGRELTLGLNFSTEMSKKCSRSSSTGRRSVLAGQKEHGRRETQKKTPCSGQQNEGRGGRGGRHSEKKERRGAHRKSAQEFGST